MRMITTRNSILFSLLPKMFKAIAKKIVCAAPLAVGVSGDYDFLFNSFSLIDKAAQNWALRQADFFSERDWREIQLGKLKNILVHAGHNVSYWHELFKKINFNPKKFQEFEELQKIPLITRGEIKKITSKKLIALNIPRWRFKEAITSGVTGEPLKFFQDLRDNLRREVNTLEELRYAGVSGRDHVAILGLENHQDLDNLGKRFSSSEWGDDKFRQAIVYPYLKLKPVTLIANGSDLRRFLFLMRREISSSIIFKTLIYRGEYLSQSERDNISRVFKCPIFTTYGSRETSLLGIECKNHKLHLAPWMNYFEVISDNGQIVTAGHEGNVVVTFYENFAMPFIRYKIGDKAMINTELCSCGRKSKTITFYGRKSELIESPGLSRSVSVVDLKRHIDNNYYQEIKQYQFELRNEKLIVFHYVLSSVLNETKKKHLINLLEKALECQFKILLEESEMINPSAGGKTPILIRSQGYNL